MIRDDYINTITALVNICVSADDPLVYLDIILFSLIAAINHIIPKGTRNNNIVKAFYTPVILNKFHPIIRFVIQVFDLIPMLGGILKHFEMIGGVLRGVVILTTMYRILKKNKAIGVLLIAIKIVYFLERRNRINKGDREEFGIMHSTEHIGILIYLMMTIPHNTGKTCRNLVIFIIATLFLVPIIGTISINTYIRVNYLKRLPFWFDHSLLGIFEKKKNKNINSLRVINYLIKPMNPELTWEIMTWKRIEHYADDLIVKIKDDGFKPDLVIGVASGGAFCAKYIAQEFKTEVAYIKSKMWSERDFADAVVEVGNYYLNDNFLDDLSYNKITEITDLSGYKPSKILLFDDTVATGKSLTACYEYLVKKFPETEIRTAAFITLKEEYDNDIVDYRCRVKTVPIIWEWGIELD